MPQRRRRAARADVLWCLTVFVAIQAAIAVALDRSWSGIRDPEYGTKLVSLRARLSENPQSPMVVMLGSSRTLNGLRPDLLPADSPRVFNFGLTSHDPVQELLCFRRLLDDGILPAGLVVEIAPILLGGDRMAVALHRQKWSDLRNLQGYEGGRAASYFGWMEHRIVPSFSYRYALLSRYRPHWMPWEQRRDGIWTQTDGNGWFAARIPAGGRQAALDLAKKSFGPVLESFTLNPVQDKALRELIALAEARGVPIALLAMPEGNVFQSWYSEETRSAVDAYLGEIQRGCGVEVVDARDWIPDEAAYLDSHHLLPEGAARFSERFAIEALPRLGLPAAGGNRPGSAISARNPTSR